MSFRYFFFSCITFLLIACQATPSGEVSSPYPSKTALDATSTPRLTKTLKPSMTALPNTATPVSPTATLVPPTASPTVTPPAILANQAPIAFTLHGANEDSFLPPSNIDTLSSRYSDPGAVIYHNGMFHMFYNVQHGYPPQATAIGYAISADGFTWTRVSQDSVLTAVDIPYNPHVILAGSVLVEADGTWVLYFYTRDEDSGLTPSRIGRATAPNPEGPWQADPEPALEPDAGGWDELALQRPSVVLTSNGYYLYYLGFNTHKSQAMIGLATSTDGIHWEKYDDPQTTEVPFSISDPVFRPEDTGWVEANILRYPRVKNTPDGWLLFYRTDTNLRGGGSQIGVASSQDGIHWTRIQNEPILRKEEYATWSIVWVYNIVFVDNKYYLFAEFMTNGASHFKVATFDNLFFPEKASSNTPENPENTRSSTITDTLGIPMVLVPEGPFLMGNEQASGAPPHLVNISDYYMDRYEVTNALFAVFLNEVGNQKEGNVDWLDTFSEYGHLHEFEGNWVPDEGYENHPVVEVSWYGARAFCEWRGTRLPTEAEWEKAARGTDERTYPWGEEINCDVANYRECNIRESVPVASYPSGISPYGIYNLAGNVAEWTADWYAAEYYSTGPQDNPRGPYEGETKASRGGSWYSGSKYLRTFHRNNEFSPRRTLRNVGLRCVLSP